jgi:hypothetical protein
MNTFKSTSNGEDIEHEACEHNDGRRGCTTKDILWKGEVSEVKGKIKMTYDKCEMIQPQEQNDIQSLLFSKGKDCHRRE